ncbi:MAG TPA: HDOD domain-containing protein [Actinomycetes bacterium]|nr:HDOD domain-containing protein [Actinomycetes bacterium]
MTAVHVGRHPIFDATRATYGYELLFRPVLERPSEPDQGEAATSQVIVDTFTEFGFDRLVGQGRAFVNVTTPFVVGGLLMPFGAPPETVLELPPTVRLDEPVVAGIRARRAEGFAIAADDYDPDGSGRQLLDAELVDFVKIDVAAWSPEQLPEVVTSARRGPATLVAKHVESVAALERCAELGIDLLQGCALDHPTATGAAGLAPTRAASLSLLAELTRPDAEIDDVVALVECDVALSYRLVRAVNAASLGVRRKISSVRDALVMLGLETLRAWIVLMSLAGEGESPSEPLRAALVRARHAELVAQAGATVRPSTAFMTGMLSTLDVLLGSDLPTVVEALPLEAEVAAALLDGAGPLGQVLATVSAYERGRPVGGSDEIDAVRRSYLSATGWADSVCLLALAS